MEKIIKVIKSEIIENYENNLKGDLLKEKLEKLNDNDYLMDSCKKVSFYNLIGVLCFDFNKDDIVKLLFCVNKIILNYDDDDKYYDFVGEINNCDNLYEEDKDLDFYKNNVLISISNYLNDDNYGLILDVIYGIKNKVINIENINFVKWLESRY